MIHSFFAHWKIDLAISTVVLGGIGLIANDVTAPHVLAVMVFLSDWNMLWTWEWWTRMIIFCTLGTALWLIQKRRCVKMVSGLQSQLNHTQLLLAAAQTRIDVLSKR